MDAIELSITNQLYVMIGQTRVSEHLLDLTARLALRGPSFLLDCGNCAQPYTIARKLRRLTLDPVQALEHLKVARAFTCYQVVTLLEEAALFCQAGQAVLIYDLLTTFYDENITFSESQRLLRRSLDGIGYMSRRVPVVVSARPPHAAFPERRVFLDWLRERAGVVWEEAGPYEYLPQQLPLFID
jgi:hypothetical protein